MSNPLTFALGLANIANIIVLKNMSLKSTTKPITPKNKSSDPYVINKTYEEMTGVEKRLRAHGLLINNDPNDKYYGGVNR